LREDRHDNKAAKQLFERISHGILEELRFLFLTTLHAQRPDGRAQTSTNFFADEAPALSN
jgi:hypothetical protein